MPAGRPSRLRRSVGLTLARRALWHALAFRGDGTASLAVVISECGTSEPEAGAIP
jgi:hypothetical protein